MVLRQSGFFATESIQGAYLMGVKNMRSLIRETGQMTVDVLDNLGIL